MIYQRYQSCDRDINDTNYNNDDTYQIILSHHQATALGLRLKMSPFVRELGSSLDSILYLIIVRSSDHHHDHDHHIHHHHDHDHNHHYTLL